MTKALATIGPLQQALALATEAGDIDALRDIASMGTALQKGAQARGLGVGAENQAAEVVLRAERAIGQTITAMREAGLLASPGASPRQWTSPDAMSIKTLADLGLGSGTDRNRVHDWQKLAKMAPETFESMLAAVKEASERISKVNFYQPDRKTHAAPAPTSEDPYFRMFREGAYGLLGYEVNADGDGIFTKNGLTSLPNDELAVIADIISEMTARYNQARAARR